MFHCILPGVVAMMKSMLQYFKPIQIEEKKQDIALPAPHGLLSSKVPPGAIKAANERVLSKLKKVSDALQFAIAKQAVQFRTTATIRYFADKYLTQFASLKEPTVRRWKNKYEKDLASVDEDDSSQDESQELCLNKTG